MRFRIYKRKVVILTLVVVICGLAFWSSGRQKKNDGGAFIKELEVVRRSGLTSSSSGSINSHIQVQATPAVKRASVLPQSLQVNETHQEKLNDKVKMSKPEVDNTTLVYRGIVFQLNFDQTIRNEERFKTVRQKDDLVVVVQIHNRPEYLKLLVDSLRKARGVESILLIFSHDYWSPEINKVVASVDFCQVLQIFFPFSIQLYPSEFPGNDPRDCPRDIPKKDALKLGCINAEYPDSFGHYREAKFSQTKHHWWWKLHFVWERVQAMQGYSGFAVFLEEDNYILPDFFHFYKSVIEFRKKSCTDCDLLALGNHNDLSDFTSMSNKVLTASWMSTKHNIGMAISREVYYKLMGCSNDFCTYDDYNWDWTLQYLSGTCIRKPLKVLAAQGSRVLHTGDCGLHQKDNCRPEWALQKIEENLQKAKDSLFPPSLSLSNAELVEHKAHMKNGGWGDIRDHTLCNNYAKRL